MNSDRYWPRLKSGVQWFRQGPDDQVYIGLRSRGILLPSSSLLLRALDLLDHQRAILTSQEIAETLRDPLFLRLLLHELLANNLLELRSSLQPVLKSLTGVQLECYLARVKPEQALASWRANNHHSIFGAGKVEVQSHIDSINEILQRSEFPILIFGRNRLAKNLLALLQATGFTRTQIINRITTTPAMDLNTDLTDLCGLVVTQADIGKTQGELSKSIVQRSALSAHGAIEAVRAGTGQRVGADTGQRVGADTGQRAASSREPKISNPALIIATQTISSDLLERWANEEIAHLMVSDIEGNQVTIGPLVIPGQSLCVRCVEISQAKKNPHLGLFAMARSFHQPPEIPVSAIAYISGLLSLEVSTYALTGASNLLERTLTFDLHNPSEITNRFWTSQGECGCLNSL
jgi:hypothetical protein